MTTFLTDIKCLPFLTAPGLTTKRGYYNNPTPGAPITCNPSNSYQGFLKAAVLALLGR